MDAHSEVLDLLGAWAVGACDAGETATVETHIARCGSCAAEAQRLRAAADLLAASRVETPPRGIRTALLTEARRRRPPDPPDAAVLGRLVDAYARQVALLDGVLTDLGADEWRVPCPRHDSIGGILDHLTANDALLAAELHLPASGSAAGDPHAAWRAQADQLVRGLAAGARPDAAVRLAGRRAPVRPLRDGVVQRAFETWTHLDDIAGLVGRMVPAPPPDHVRHVVDFAVALLPTTLAGLGTGPDDGIVRLALGGDGGGEWTFPVRPDGGGQEILIITADAVDLCHLAANRLAPQELPHRATGDPALAARVLRATAMLGCD